MALFNKHRRVKSSTDTTNNSSSLSTTSKSKKKKVILHDISKELIPITGTNKFAILLHNVLTPSECSNLIKRAEQIGFDNALIQGPNGKQILRTDIRSCERCIIDDDELADMLYKRILSAIEGHEELEKKLMYAPWASTSKKKHNSSSNSGVDHDRRCSTGMDNNSNDRVMNLKSVGLNERMRFLKYKPGHFFAPHQDIQYTRGPEFGPKAGEASYITVQLYLNDKFKGGSTRFLCGSVKNPSKSRHYDVKPKVGSVLIFDHDILHEGSEVKNGTKYSVRTDIMYTSTYRIKQQQRMEHNEDQKQQRRVTSSVASLVEDRDRLGIFGNLSTDDAT